MRRDTVVNWLHQVVKNEALAAREARRRLVASEEVEPDGHTASPEDRVVSIDRTQRAAEALSRLKPQEVQALWLRAQGLSYQEIAQRQSWTYTNATLPVWPVGGARLARCPSRSGSAPRSRSAHPPAA